MTMTTTAADDAYVRVSHRDAVLEIGLAGRLTAGTVPQVWGGALDPVRLTRAQRVVVEGSGLTYCDGAGLALFAEIRRTAAIHARATAVEGLAPELLALVQRAALPDPLAPQLRPPRVPGFLEQVGRGAADLFDDLRTIIAFLGELVAALAWAVFHPRRVRWADLLTVAVKAGVDAVPVVSLLGFLIGVILAYQCAVAMQRYGITSAIPAVVGIAMLRELGPLITAVLLAGRSGSAYAAEIGTMTVTEEVSALRTLGLNPVRFLAVPRVLAAMLVTPLLAVFCNLLGVLGGYTVMAGYQFTFAQYVNAVRNATNYEDLAGGVFKTVVFAFIVGGIGCLRGLRTGDGPGAVGDSTTRAVVAGIVLVIVADGLFGIAYYYLGI
jgi:phospholipid/cholesterol/gamma-HCH transport system permease protein